MPFQKIPDLDLEYALISFDDDGTERPDDPVGGVFSRTLLERAQHERPTDVFLFSHGWKGDLPAAIDQYNRWIGALWRLEADRRAMGSDFQPMFIGLHWPSQPWGDESIAEPVSFDITRAAAAAAPPNMNRLLEEAVEHFGGTEEVRRALRVIFDAQAANPTSFVVPEEAVAAYHALAHAVGFSAGAGADAPPDREGAALDPQQAVTASRIADAGAQFGIGASLKKGILGGLRQISFWIMKKRARTIGEGGMHRFVSALLSNCDAEVHLMGHSFGCIVASSVLGGPDGRDRLARPVASAVLVQGAVSLWSWGERVKDLDTPGYFRSIIANGAVSGPIVTTRSVHDKAVGLAYPAAVALVGQAAFNPNDFPLFGGVGTYGLQGTSIAEPGQLALLEPSGSYHFKPGRLYNLEGSQYIPSHNGIDGPEVAHAIWQAALSAEPGRRA